MAKTKWRPRAFSAPDSELVRIDQELVPAFVYRVVARLRRRSGLSEQLRQRAAVTCVTSRCALGTGLSVAAPRLKIPERGVDRGLTPTAKANDALRAECSSSAGLRPRLKQMTPFGLSAA